MTELRLLGGVSIAASDGSRADELARQPKRLALLVYLAIALPRGFWRRDQILPLLWPNLSQERARAALRKTLHHLKHALPAGTIITRGKEEVAISLESLWIDGVQFDALLDVGSETEALDLYRGDLMPGFHLEGCPDFVRWLDGERARLRRRAARATWLAVERAVESDDASVSSLIQRALELHPMDEAGVRRAMQLLADRGNVGEAIMAYEAFSDRLAADFGALPDPATAELQAAITTKQAGARPSIPAQSIPETPGTRETPASLAVIPFVDMSSDQSLEWFGEGLSEEIINRLVQVGGIHVAARTSSFAFKGSGTDARVIGRQLGVDAVLEGSVRSDGERYRITAQLIRAADGFHLWSINYDSEERDLFTVQDELAVEITQHLLADGNSRQSGAETVSPERRNLVQRSRVSPGSYRELLQGRHQLLRRNPGSLQRSTEHFNKAIALDPQFGAAHAGLAECYAILPVYTSMKAVDALPLARAAAERALSLDPSLAGAHATKAFASLAYDWDWSGGERGYEQALELDPGDARVRAVYAMYVLSSTSRHELAIAEVERAGADDPMSLPIQSYVAFTHMFARDFDTAAKRARKLIELDDEFVLGHWVLGATLQCMGEHGDAIDEYRRIVELARASPVMLVQLALGLAAAGEREESESILDSLAGEKNDPSYPPVFGAMALAELGRADEAIEQLWRAYRERAVHLVFMNVDARFDSLRGDPRFRELVLRIGLMPGRN